MEALHVRWAVRRDVPAVLAVSDASFTGGWAEEDFLRALARRDTIMYVAERGDRIVGYCVYRLHPHCIELVNLAVHPAHRRGRVGMDVVAKLARKLVEHRRSALVASVPEANTAALLFFRACDMTAVRFDRAAGAVLMEYRPTAEDWARAGYDAPPVNRIAKFLA
jgi:ribosomal-protein-alanine N-acetyltransferase